MSKNWTLYNTEGLYVGPCPASGFHFVSSVGTQNDDYTNTGNVNLLFPIHRVQDIHYNFDIDRNYITALGKHGTVSRPIINSPTVNLNFSYLQFGIINELRMGLYVNYTQEDEVQTGVPFYHNNFGVFLLSGFINRKFTPPQNTIGFPYSYRDKRNIFVAVAPEGTDLNDQTERFTVNNPSQTAVYAFGNCYMSNYGARAAVNSFPTVSITYTCENLMVSSSGSGVPIPAINPRDRTPIPNKHFSIPSLFRGPEKIKVLKPGDITIDITSTPEVTGTYAIAGTGSYLTNYVDQYNLGLKISNMKIQDYSIDLPLNRQPEMALGYKLPLDREINFPIFVNTNIGVIVGDSQTGSLDRLVNLNDDYNITIKLNTPANAPTTGVGVQYDFRKAKLNGVTYTHSIENEKVANLSFVTEMDPSDLNGGFFVSGLLNISRTNVLSQALLQEDGNYILQEDGCRIFVESFSAIY